MNKPKNLIIEQIPDTKLKNTLYKLLEKDVAIYYAKTTKQLPSATNLIQLDGLAIFVTPTTEQKDYVERRIVDLYDDVSPDLKDFTKVLLDSNKPMEETLSKILTQYDAKEVAKYLVESFQNGTLQNFSSTKLVDNFIDYANYKAAEVHGCYYKGELVAYSLTILKEEMGFCMFYEDSLNYMDALKWFYHSVKEHDRYLLKGLMDKQQQM